MGQKSKIPKYLQPAHNDGWIQWVRRPIDHIAVQEGCWFDIDAAQRVRSFLRDCVVVDGQPFDLWEWQWNDVIAPLFGWKRADGTRRFRQAYIEIPKKNGKSILISAIALYLLIADGETRPEIYMAAASRDQAGVMYRYAAHMVRESPELQQLLQIFKAPKTITNEHVGGFVRAICSDANTTDGLNASAVLVDELHRHRSPDLWDTLRYSGAARSQPLALAISTAGDEKQGICWEMHQYAERVNHPKSPVISDTGFLGVIYAADPARWDDEEQWRAANPAYDLWPDRDGFRRAYAEAAEVPRKRANFRRLRLNIWTEQSADTWLDMAKWDACAGPHPFAAMEQALSQRVSLQSYGGGDFAKGGGDLSAFVLVMPDDNGVVSVLPYFWMPREIALQREKQDRVPYTMWAEQGYMRLMDGDYIDPRDILADIIQLCERYGCTNVAYDPAWVMGWDTVLSEAGIEIYPFRQSVGHYHPACREVERLLAGGLLRHGGHPVLRWMASNATAYERDGKIMPRKTDRTGRIDGISAMTMACGGLVAGNAAQKWDDFELMII